MEKYAKPRPVRRSGVIERAQEVPVFDVLQDWFGIEAPREGASYKGFCPFSFEHSDAGASRAMRTYPASNSAYCFDMHGLMTPVRLVSEAEGLAPLQAARLILKRYGIELRQPWRTRYQELVSSAGASDRFRPQDLVEALHEVLRRRPDYGARIFADDVSTVMAGQLAALEDVDERSAAEWVARAAAEVSSVMGAPQG